MILTWLIEIYLNQLGVLKEQGQDNTDLYDKLQEEFRKFLAQPRVKVSIVVSGCILSEYILLIGLTAAKMKQKI